MTQKDEWVYFVSYAGKTGDSVGLGHAVVKMTGKIVSDEDVQLVRKHINEKRCLDELPAILNIVLLE